MAKFDAQREFDAIGPPAFAFLVEAEGFVGPEIDNGLFYYSPELSVEVGVDERERILVTLLSRRIGQYYRRARLPCLYVEAGLGPAQDIHLPARTCHSIQLSVASQAEALMRILPAMRSTRVDEFLLRCHGR